MRRRLDAELVRRGLVPGRAAAREMVESGRVTVDGAPALKASRMVDPAQSVQVAGPGPRFVSRGGEKLDAALDRFELDPSGLTLLDAGASTGGFTDCLLQRGASHVVALDVGRAQLHERLRNDPRVEVRERTNLREVDPAALGPVDAAVADLSFISLTLVMGVLVDLVLPGGWLVLLVKPQFEAGRQEVSRGRGVVSDPAVWRRTLGSVLDAAERRGAAMMGVMVSPLRGAEGNVEFLLHLVRRGAPSAAPADSDAVADRDAAAELDSVVDAAARWAASGGPTPDGGHG